MEAYLALPRRHQKFVDAYVECGNGAEAVRRAKLRNRAYKDPKVAASKLKAKPEIAAAIAERQAEAIADWNMRMQRWLVELDRIATFNERDIYDEHGNLRPIHELPEEVAAAISGIEDEDLFEGNGKDRRRIGRVRKVKTWNKNEAIKTLLQFVGKLPERHEHTGKNGAPISLAVRATAALAMTEDPNIAAQLYSDLVSGKTDKPSGE